MRFVSKTRPVWITAAAAVTLFGCAQWPPPAKLGNSVAHDRAVHIINPDPNWGTTPPDLDGERAALLMRRYSGQAVVQPEEVSTQ